MSTRADRRLAAKQRAKADRKLDDWVRQMNEQGGGLMAFEIIAAPDFAQCVIAAALGDHHAAVIAQAVGNAVARLPPDALCLCCPSAIELKASPSFVVTLPSSDAATHALASALCCECAAKPDVVANVVAALKEIWPDARPINVSNQTGHA